MLFGVSLILFTIMRLAPGGPEAVLIGGEFSPDRRQADIDHRTIDKGQAGSADGRREY